MSARVGSIVRVRLLRSYRDAYSSSDYTEVAAQITSQSPPGVGADWGRTTDKPGQWLLVRPDKDRPGKYWAALDDPGMP